MTLTFVVVLSGNVSRAVLRLLVDGGARTWTVVATDDVIDGLQPIQRSRCRVSFGEQRRGFVIVVIVTALEIA